MIYTRYTWDIPKIYPRYTWDIPEIYPRYTKDLPKKCTWDITDMPDSTLAVATSCHWVKKIISYSNFHQTFQIGSYFFRNTYGLVKKIFRAKKRTSIGLIFSHFRSIFLIFELFFSPTENFVIFICFTINFLNCFVYCPSGHFKINV